MAFRVKCPECNSCMSPLHKDTTRYLYCGFCRQYYAGRTKDLTPVPSPFTPVTGNKIEDPILEEENDRPE